MMRVVSTRKLPAYVVDYANTIGIQIDCIDFIEVKPLQPDFAVLENSTFDAVAFTSANAVRFFFDYPVARQVLNQKIIFSLAGKTTEELLLNGIRPTFTAPNAAELAKLIEANRLVTSLLHVCGNLKLNVIEERLANSAVAYLPLVVYETVLKEGQHLTEHYDAVMFYSPSGVKAFFTTNGLNESQVFCCIGNTTASVVRERDKNLQVIISPKSSPEAMIETISEYFKMQRNQTWPG